MLGGKLSRQRLYQVTSHRDFPEPVAKLAMGNVWRTQDVRAWAKATGRDLPGDEPQK